MVTHLDIPADRVAYVAVVSRRRQIVVLPPRTKVDVLKTDRILVGLDNRTATAYRLPQAGVLCRTDAWLRLKDTPLAQPAELRN